MHKPLILELICGPNALAMKTRKKRGRTRSIKTLVVVENAAIQTISTSGIGKTSA
jgi:hypothetical protein